VDGPILDFGCGTGCLTMALRDDLGEHGVTGVDTSRAMLEQFERKAEEWGRVKTAAVEVRTVFKKHNTAQRSTA